MSKKNPFEGVIQKKRSGGATTGNLPMMGAGRSIMGSIETLAKQAGQLVEGETIIELDPTEVDPSFIQDRLDDGADFDDFVKSIEKNGQQTPALVRPHPTDPKRYMLVFGRRRWKAARILGRKLRAVVKKLSENEHVILQGQENAARANLSYLERARYARQLSEHGFDTDTLLSALSTDNATLSKLLSVAGISSEILDQFGAAHSIGRDRFYELKKLLDRPGSAELAKEKLSSAELAQASPEQKLKTLVSYLKVQNSPTRKSIKAKERAWASVDNNLSAKSAGNRRKYLITLNSGKGADAERFGSFLSDQLPELYAKFLKATEAGEQ
ncbi:plasmid partitioning protein RepB [Roseibium algae]|uniref:Plasmid partitioning protein RepB n=1 Tax=Roseibium algae TaxID=3123038 RepID=A0ABU8TTQ2_9HYPH